MQDTLNFADSGSRSQRRDRLNVSSLVNENNTNYLPIEGNGFLQYDSKQYNPIQFKFQRFCFIIHKYLL